MTRLSLPALLDQQEQKALALKELLQHELETLKARELTVLEQKAKEKEECLNLINQIDRAIRQHADVASLQTSPELSEQIARIQDIFKECKEQNEINGQIINNSQIAINRFKGLLQKSTANNTMTYDQKGQTNVKTRSIGIKA